MPINPNELRDRLALWRLPGMGPVTFKAALQRFGSATSALQASSRAWSRLPARPELLASVCHPDWSGVDQDLRWLEERDHHLLILGEPGYPEPLAGLHAPPPLLFVRGDPELLSWPQLAIVGSRQPSRSGTDTAMRLASELALSGLIITSGLALGIDAAAHRAGLRVDGRTIAVIATGPDRCYPHQHKVLTKDILSSGGAIVTEFPTGVSPKRAHFPRRNRLISGLSLATLVVEASLRSGSLITARHALDQGKEVFAVPGSILNPLAKGCNDLIKRGEAQLIDTVDDILEEIAVSVGAISPMPPVVSGLITATDDTRGDRLPDEANTVLAALAHDPAGIDQLCQRCGLTADLVSSILLQLELQGLVEALRGGRFMRRPLAGPLRSP